MADSKLSALTSAGALSDADLLLIVQGGASLKVTWGALKSAVLLAKYPEVANYAALPAAAGVSGQTYVCLAAQGTYFINRKPAGFYYSNGTTWAFVGELPENYFTDSILQISDDADPTKICKFQLSGITTGTTRVLTVPDKDGTIACVSDLPDFLAQVHAASSKATPVDADEIPLADSAASYALKKLTWANLKATLAAFTGDSGSGGVKGVVPAPAAGDAAAGKYLKADGTWATPAGGGGSGTKTYAFFSPKDNQPPAANFATLDTRNSIAVLDFDDTTNESAVFVGVIPEAASLGSGLKIRLHWMATSATSGAVRWGAQLERMNTDEDSDSFDTAAEANGSANGTSGIITTTEITLTTIDSVAAGDPYRVKIYRNSADTGNDTMTGDAELVAIEIRSAA